MVGVALELSVIIGWPITGGGVARGPRLTNPGQVVGKQHLSPTPRPPLAMPMDEMTNENQYRMNTIILFYRQHALHAMQAPIY